MADRYDLSRVSRETLERLARAQLAEHVPSEAARQLLDLTEATKAVRSEARLPLRTRAEVDAQIVRTVRIWWGAPEPGLVHGLHSNTVEALESLCAEPTQDSGPSSADGAEVSSPRPPASPAGADLCECPFCRCTQGRHVIWCQYPRGVDVSAGAAFTWAPERNRRIVAALKDVPLHLRIGSAWARIEELMGGDADSGPPGAAAAKESGKTDAAAPEGAALHDVTGDMPRWQCTRNGCGHWNRSIHRRCIRCGELNLDGEPPESHACNPPPLRDPDCNCEQALELQQKLGRVEALVKLWSLQVADYPSTTEGQFGAAGVRCCIRELKEALRP